MQNQDNPQPHVVDPGDVTGPDSAETPLDAEAATLDIADLLLRRAPDRPVTAPPASERR